MPEDNDIHTSVASYQSKIFEVIDEKLGSRDRDDVAELTRETFKSYAKIYAKFDQWIPEEDCLAFLEPKKDGNHRWLFVFKVRDEHKLKNTKTLLSVFICGSRFYVGFVIPTA